MFFISDSFNNVREKAEVCVVIFSGQVMPTLNFISVPNKFMANRKLLQIWYIWLLTYVMLVALQARTLVKIYYQFEADLLFIVIIILTSI